MPYPRCSMAPTFSAARARGPAVGAQGQDEGRPQPRETPLVPLPLERLCGAMTRAEGGTSSEGTARSDQPQAASMAGMRTRSAGVWRARRREDPGPKTRLPQIMGRLAGALPPERPRQPKGWAAPGEKLPRNGKARDRLARRSAPHGVPAGPRRRMGQIGPESETGAP